jgi:hypothetical protein
VSHRVRIGTCSGPADAALVRSMFSAHGIAVVIGAENHAGLLAGLGGAFLSLDIWVDEEESEEALALLHDLRERDERSVDGDDDDEDFDGDAADPAGESRDDAADPAGDPVQLRMDRRRQTGIVLLLGCCVSFGTAHLFTRAWVRGITLAAVELGGVMQLWDGHGSGGLLVIAAMLADVIGALWRVRSATTPSLPRARLHGR